MNYRDFLDKRKEQAKSLIAINPGLSNVPGIYIFKRYEGKFKYAYVGQAVKILNRLIDHLNGYDTHIDKSLRKHKLWSVKNRTGWTVDFIRFSESELNSKETEYIARMHEEGYQLLNKTSGSQGVGKVGIELNKDGRGYLEGLKNGYLKAKKEFAVFFEKYLDFAIKGKTNKIKERKYNEFSELLRRIENE